MGARSSLDLERDPRSIIGMRVFDAARELVFAAFTDPRHLAQWWGPDGFTTTTSEFDFRPGGVWRFVMHGPDGRDYQNRITFDDIVPPQRLVYHHDGGDDVEPVRFTQTLTFEDVGNGQTRLTWHGTFASAEERARVIDEYGADKGLAQTMARLADYVAAQVKSARTSSQTSGGNMTAAADPKRKDFTMSRVFDAPRDVLWKCFTDPERMKHWWGPKGFKVLHSKMDLRVGGTYHYGMQAPDGKAMWGKFTYREVVPEQKLVFINSFSDEQGGVTRHPMAPTWPLELLSVFTFEDEPGGKTKFTIRWSPHNASEEERKTFEAGHASMTQGWGGTMEQLEAYLARAK